MPDLKLDAFLAEEAQACESQTVTDARVGDRVLRPYQVEAYEAWVSRGSRGIVIAPTGTGKTIIGLYAIMRSSVPTLVVTPYERVMKEWIKKGKESGITFTRYYASEKVLSRFTVAIYNSVVRHPEILDDFELIILDEIHHVGADVFSRILPKLDYKKVLGFTATLRREDGKHQTILAKLPVVYVLDLKSAMENGYVAPVQVIPVPARMDDFERKEYMRIQSEIRKTASDLKRLKAVFSESDPRVLELERKLRILTNERRIFLSRINAKKDALLNVVRRHHSEKVIVFSESIESIEDLKDYLVGNGIPAETYHSGKSEQERSRIFAEWGRSFNVLLAVRALDEGVDVPEVAVGVVIASGQSVRQLVQRKGRIMRPKEGKQARLYVIYAQESIEYMLVLKINAILKNLIRLY
ncbi:MAG: DEAD/DEAH box helicase [Nitrososphaerota archaeon]